MSTSLGDVCHLFDPTRDYVRSNNLCLTATCIPKPSTWTGVWTNSILLQSLRAYHMSRENCSLAQVIDSNPISHQNSILARFGFLTFISRLTIILFDLGLTSEFGAFNKHKRKLGAACYIPISNHTYFRSVILVEVARTSVARKRILPLVIRLSMSRTLGISSE